jgi:CheY-like chemotaxis protein
MTPETPRYISHRGTIGHVRGNAEERACGASVTGTIRRSPGLVLLVDDEPAIVEMLAFLFEDEGYPVARAFDGEQALILVEQVAPALVISDISLPKLNGVELARRLRMRPAGAVPAILMSAAVRDVPGEGVAFVPKPFDPMAVLLLARRYLDVV